jgi:hypothetical protein
LSAVFVEWPPAEIRKIPRVQFLFYFYRAFS